ncbi:MAG: response regulator [Phycisphaerales bacterium]
MPDAPVTRITGGDVPPLLDAIGDGVGVVDPSGEILWMNNRLAAQAPETMRRFSDACRDQLRDGMDASRHSHMRSFQAASKGWEVVISPHAGPGGEPRAIGVLHEVTVRQRLLQRIEAVDRAGSSLLALDAEILNPLNVAERLKLIEGRIEQAIRTLFDCGEFELRLLNRESRQLELVIGKGIEPLRIGQSLFARAEGNGITGLVAATGEGVVCPDTARDARYVGGLPGARSSVTVPLLLHDRVAGTLNLESVQPARFDDEDRLLLELYGRYAAMALTILDMLIVERFTTNQRVSGAVREEIAVPVRTLRTEAEKLRESAGRDAAASAALVRLEAAIDALDARIKECTAGPRTVLGVDRIDRTRARDPSIAGRTVLVAEDEPQVRETIQTVLSDAGALVTPFDSGAAAISAVTAAAEEGRPFDLVISDVRMPDRNGYEVFRATKDAHAGTPVILMTGFGYDPHHSIVRSSQEGLSCFLFKPFQATQLIEEVRKALSAAASPPAP